MIPAESGLFLRYFASKSNTFRPSGVQTEELTIVILNRIITMQNNPGRDLQS